MPTVKRYGQPKVSSQLVQGAKASSLPSSSFANVGEGLTAIAEGIDRVDTTTAEESLVSFEREKNDLFFNADTGYFKTQGKTAYDGAEGITKSLSDLADKYSKDFGSDNAREKFDKVAATHVTRGNADVQKHAATGFKAWESATIKSGVENTLENASLFFKDDERLSVQLALGEQNIRDLADINGLNDANLVNEDLETYRSSFYASAAQSAIIQSASDGEEVLKKYGSRIEGPELNKLNIQLQRKQKEERTRNNAIEATTRATKLMSSGMSYSEMINEVSLIEDKEVQKQTRADLAYQNKQMKSAEASDIVDSYKVIYDLLGGGEGLEVLKITYAPDWERLTPKLQASLSKVSSGSPVETDWIVYNEILSLPPNDLKDFNIASALPYLGKTEMKEVIKLVRDANKPNSDDDDKIIANQPGRTRISQTNNYVNKLFGTVKSRNDNEKKSVNTFYSMLDREVRLQKANKGAELSSEEYTLILKTFTREYVIKKSGFLGIGGITLKLKSDFDDSELDEIIQYLHDNDRPATEKNIMEVYRQASQ